VRRELRSKKASTISFGFTLVQASSSYRRSAILRFLSKPAIVNSLVVCPPVSFQGFYLRRFKQPVHFRSSSQCCAAGLPEQAEFAKLRLPSLSTSPLPRLSPWYYIELHAVHFRWLAGMDVCHTLDAFRNFTVAA